MHRARYLVFLELCFVGLWCLATFLFALFALTTEDGWISRVIGFVQICLTFVTLLVTHLTLRTVFRRGANFTAQAIAASTAFRAVPVIVIAVGVLHYALLVVSSAPFGEFGWEFTLYRLSYVFALAVGWHAVTAWFLSRAPIDANE
ncbi:MAG: hypothetical protein EPO26_08230 [Chloroflexota bacterium]|nr:MAG: hypothetical protein EPO26_08230 [Chloroflexota bacterium]